MKYRAFISYRHLEPDRTVAVSVHRLLEKYTVPSRLRRNGEKHLGRIFRDEDELPLSVSLSDSILAALEESEFLIVICSPGFRESLWCMREVDTFIRLHGRDRVLCVLVSGNPEESFPPQLLSDETGRSVEPLAANLSSCRPGEMRSRLRREYLRLAAAIIGCDFDDLVQRAQRRKVRLAFSAAGVIAATAICFVSVLLVKNNQIKQTLLQSQRNESEAVAGVAANLLQSGDRISAIRQTVNALPGESDPDRPYVPSCEEVLADALYVYHDEKLFTQRALVDTVSQIVDIAVARDGSLAFTVCEPCTVKAFSPSGEQLWETSVLESKWPEYPEIICLDPDVLLVNVAGNVCRLDQNTGEILWRLDNDFLVACEDHFLLLKSGSSLEPRKPYRLVDPDGQVLLDFDPDPDGRYSFLKWEVNSDGQIVALGSPAGSEDSLLLFILEKDTGKIRHVIPLDVTAARWGEENIQYTFDLSLTRELALVFHQTSDWNQVDGLTWSIPSVTRAWAWRLDQGTQAWSWQTDALSGTPEIWANEDNQLLAVCSQTSEVIPVLSLLDGHLISEASLPGSLYSVTPYITPVGAWCLRALLFDGSIMQINPEIGFSMAFGGAAGDVFRADMCSRAEKIAVAASVVNSTQKLMLISRVSNPDCRDLVPEPSSWSVAVSPDKTILIVGRNEADRNASDLWFLNPDGTEARKTITIPDQLYTSLMGFTPDGKHVVFGKLESNISYEVLVSLEDGSVTRKNQELSTMYYISQLGKNIWSADLNHQTIRIFREEELLWDQPLPERISQPLTAAIGGSGWLALYKPDSDISGRVLLCDLEAGSWHSLPDTALRSAPVLACGNGQKLLALADAENIFVYGESLTLLHRYPLPVERNAVEFCSFSADDELLCLGLTGNRFCLLRLSDGLASDIIDADNTFTEIWAEKTVQGDYAITFKRFGSDTGFLIREDSLKIRARIPGLLAVLPESNLILRKGEMPYSSSLYISPAYSLEELLKMAESRFK